MYLHNTTLVLVLVTAAAVTVIIVPVSTTRKWPPSSNSNDNDNSGSALNPDGSIDTSQAIPDGQQCRKKAIYCTTNGNTCKKDNDCCRNLFCTKNTRGKFCSRRQRTAEE